MTQNKPNECGLNHFTVTRVIINEFVFFPHWFILYNLYTLFEYFYSTTYVNNHNVTSTVYCSGYILFSTARSHKLIKVFMI